jgi:hypothetical protein
MEFVGLDMEFVKSAFAEALAKIQELKGKIQKG